jgi:hypothetical protein
VVSITREFFLYCSGANKEILERPECAIDYPKFIGIGVTVFFSAILAALSAGYAFYLTFQSLVLSYLLGALWGLIIFMLDRFIVSTFKRKVIPPTPSLIERLRLRSDEILRALPRIVLAIMVSALIVVPIELRLFEKELNARVAEHRVDEVAAARRQVREQFPDIDRLKTENDRLEQAIALKRKQTADLLESLLDNPPPSIAELIIDQRTKEFLSTRAQFQELKKVNQGIIAANSQKLEYLNAQADAQERQIASVMATTRSDGLLMRMQAMSELKAKNKTIATFSILILLLFILLETAPVIVKLLSNVGPYEYFWAAFESMANLMDRANPGPVNKIEEIAETDQIAKQSYEKQGLLLQTSEVKSDGQLRAFLCHSAHDKPAIRSLCKKLKEDNIDAWLDEERILPGQYWEAEITRAMRSCDVVIACLSRKSVNKAGYVQKEIKYAVELAFEQPEDSIFLIPAKLDECDIPGSLSRLQWVNLFADNGYHRLMLALHKRANENGYRLADCSEPL